MKKFLKLMVSISVLFLVVGCGNKKVLECTQEDEYENLKTTITYKKDQLDSMLYTIYLPIGEDVTDEDVDAAIEEFQNVFNEDGIKLDVEKGKDGVTFTSNLSGEQVKTLMDDENQDLSYDALKQKLEESGYTCK